MADQIASIGQGAMRASVANAVRDAANETGVAFDYLYRVAERESSLDPRAEARTSSAAGLYQFIEQTWLSAVKKYGARHGMAAEAAAIEDAGGGRYRVRDADYRGAILDLRFDARKSAALAGEFTRDNRERLEGVLGRPVTAAELYAAHFLGAGGAERLLTASHATRAADLLPEAAAANRPVFFDGARARSVGELIADFSTSVGEALDAPPLREGPPSTAPFGWIAGDQTRAAEPRLARAPMVDRAPISELTLSPLAIVVLQSLDPLTLIGDDARDERSASR